MYLYIYTSMYIQCMGNQIYICIYTYRIWSSSLGPSCSFHIGWIRFTTAYCNESCSEYSSITSNFWAAQHEGHRKEQDLLRGKKQWNAREMLGTGGSYPRLRSKDRGCSTDRRCWRMQCQREWSLYTGELTWVAHPFFQSKDNVENDKGVCICIIK